MEIFGFLITIIQQTEDSFNMKVIKTILWVLNHMLYLNQNFVKLLTNYYNKIYLGHKNRNANKTPAPKNFWPYSYQFYMCNPIKVLDCLVKNANSNPKISIDYYASPETDRNILPSEPMPISILNKQELTIISEITGIVLKELKERLPFISEDLRLFLPLRDTDKISETKPYKRN